jgi:uncharacterized membrane protein YphA (DoxX/SURF4 family)
MKYVANLCRLLVGALFIFSGGVKAIDPVGTAIKMEEYFEIFGIYAPKFNFIWHAFANEALAFSIFMIILEIFLGITLLLGTWKRFTIWMLILIIAFFTFLTGFSAQTGKVTDCGCFGDFIKLTPSQSFQKDLVLCVLIAILVVGARHIKELFSKSLNRILVSILTLVAIVFTFRNVYYEPIKDFRAYQVGTSIPECLKLPSNAKKPVIDMVYTYKSKKTGEIKEFKNTWPQDYDNWTYVDRKDVVIQKGDEPKCKDFAIKDANGSDYAASFFEEEEYLFLIIVPDLKKSAEDGFRKIVPVCEAALKDNRYVYLLTGSVMAEVDAYKKHVKIPFEVFNTDGTPLKTIMRSNPGLLILKKGIVVAKYHYHEVPTYEELKKTVLK